MSARIGKAYAGRHGKRISIGYDDTYDRTCGDEHKGLSADEATALGYLLIALAAEIRNDERKDKP